MKQFFRECWNIFISDRYLRCRDCGDLYTSLETYNAYTGHTHREQTEGDAWRNPRPS